jgi:hypothetical protein
LLATLALSFLFNGVLVELQASGAPVGTFLNSRCNVCLLILLSEPPRLPQRHFYMTL